MSHSVLDLDTLMPERGGDFRSRRHIDFNTRLSMLAAFDLRDSQGTLTYSTGHTLRFQDIVRENDALAFDHHLHGDGAAQQLDCPRLSGRALKKDFGRLREFLPTHFRP